MIKENHGFKDVAIKDIPLHNLKSMYVQLTSEGGK